MPSKDSDKEIGALLSYLTGRLLTTKEVLEALGMSSSTYYLQREEGRPVSTDHLIRAARTLSINEIELLTMYGRIDPEAAMEYTERAHPPRPDAARADKPLRTAAPPTKKKHQKRVPRHDIPPL